MKFKLPSGEVCLIDRQDYWLVEKFRWHKVNGYIQTEVGSRKYKDRKLFRLHRIIMKAEPGQMVDHINRNVFDNRRSNLRFADRSINGINRGPQKNSSTGIKGVCFDKRSGYWRAYLSLKGKQIYSANFKKLDDAVQARKEAELKYHLCS